MLKNINILKKIKILRITHWIKNLIIFLPLIFSNKFLDLTNFLIATKLFLHFSLLSSAVYVFNDILDFEKDKNHPIKRLRAIPQGIVSIKQAVTLHIFLIFLSIFFLSKEILYVSVSYLILNYLYSIFLKKIFILDIIIVCFGYYLRVLSISIVTNTPLSLYFIIMVFLIAFFILLSKRYLSIKFSNIDESKNLKFFYFKFYKTLSIFLLILISIVFNKYISENFYIAFSFKFISILTSQIILLIILFIFYKLVISLNKDENPVSIFFKNKKIYITSYFWIFYNIVLYLYVL